MWIVADSSIITSMLYLKVGKSGGRDYLSIVRGYWDPVVKRSRTKTIQSLGYLDQLSTKYKDPISHFKNVVSEMNAEVEKEPSFFELKADLSTKLSGINHKTGH